jgi:hypothetical protein
MLINIKTACITVNSLNDINLQKMNLPYILKDRGARADGFMKDIIFEFLTAVGWVKFTQLLGSAIMKKLLLIPVTILPFFLFAYTIKGVVKDSKGNPLPFSSVLLKGSTRGITANSQGRYSLQVEAGDYVLICQHIGYKTEEKNVTVNQPETEVDFELQEQQYDLKEVIVTSSGEDPAYRIIRQAIKKREDHLNEIKKFSCQVYLKGQIQLRNYPKNFMGKTVDFEDGDTSKRKMIFLSETVAGYSVDGDKKKIEVVSTKVSGSSNGFGFSDPQIISFYENVISMGGGLNPRGFISPVANNALSYYKYKLEGTFNENGRKVYRIKVIPKRKYEPLFGGHINITDDEWRLQNVQLTLLKENAMQFLDTLTIEQLYVPFKNVWVIKQQVIYPAGKFLGFDFFGSFVQVYDKFDMEPVFAGKFFGNTILKFFDSSNKKNLAYWDSIRPLPLLEAEAKDYVKKDSLEQLRKRPEYLDSLDRKRNKVTFSSLFLTGQNLEKEKRKENLSFDALIWLCGLYYNSVEGRERLSINPNFRYGFSNKHFNAYINNSYSFGKKYVSTITASGGKKVFQFNNDNPISELNNTISTYFWQHNYMKTYEAGFGKVVYTKDFGDGFSASFGAQFQDRKPLENSIDSLRGKVFSPNYPAGLVSSNIPAHKAFITTVDVSWRPGAKYVELPDRKINIGSKFPLFRLRVTQGVNGWMGSNVDYTKWQVNISDHLNFKLGGLFRYNIEAGGFLNARKTFIPDYQQYLGNQTVIAGQYMNSFQLLPYYQFSNTENFYTAAHAEYHLNGLLTNKIPGFRKLNWFLVAGTNILYIHNHSGYYEAFISIENILKIARIDIVQSFQQNSPVMTGIRFSIPLLIGSGGNAN